jgi:D-glycerate 3-kinase
LIKQFPKREKPYFICFTGGQGSGKTTLSFFVQKVLNETFNRPAMGFSIDDIYKSQEERRALANNVHPLCYVRGVPGTHDVNMGLDLIDQLSRANQDTQTKIPSFCKPEDKHYPIEDWPVYIGKPDFIFFDAWCGGARPLPEEDWLPPLNQLEAEEDPDGIWSKWSNKELSKDYQTLFSLFDVLLMIKVPSMDFVYESRWIQEQTLAKTVTDPVLKKKIMTRDQVYRFVMHYERLTHYILEELPDFSDIVLSRDGNFKFSISKTP